MSKFTKNELKADSESDWDLDSHDKELMTKLNKSDFDYNLDPEVELKKFILKKLK